MTYIPKQGDIVWFTFDPQSCHKQKGRQPALVVSKDLFEKDLRGMIVVGK